MSEEANSKAILISINREVENTVNPLGAENDKDYNCYQILKLVFKAAIVPDTTKKKKSLNSCFVLKKTQVDQGSR